MQLKSRSTRTIQITFWHLKGVAIGKTLKVSDLLNVVVQSTQCTHVHVEHGWPFKHETTRVYNNVVLCQLIELNSFPLSYYQH